jgi:uncharacterized cupredoxin-like copper-binding protein
MRLRQIALAPALMLVVAACSSGGSTSSPSAPPASPQAADSGSPAAQRIEVRLTDTLKMEPAEMTVKAGQPVTFVVTNTGAIEHEFYLGDEAMQAEQEAMMQSGEMVHDTAEGISLKPGETKELTYTFDAPGQPIAGCHVAGHYAGGMKAAITVTE